MDKHSEIQTVLDQFGIGRQNSGAHDGTAQLLTKGPEIEVYSPVDGARIATVATAANEDYEKIVHSAAAAFLQWRLWPAPKRGEVIRKFALALRTHKEMLGKLVSYEMGKSLQEGAGEVQEMIDICDFGVGLSRQLYGLTMHSERPDHRMYEQWHPLGIVSIITAFNFPVAVWSWNAVIALVTGNVTIWKPSEKTPLSAQACMHILAAVFKGAGVPAGVCNLIQGTAGTGALLAADTRISLVSATGSTGMGTAVGQVVAARLGKCLLELGGNNAIIITASANLKLALTGAVFGSVGTAGQRCTSTRRLIIHRLVYDRFVEQLINAYRQLVIGNPLDPAVHMGPLIDQGAVEIYEHALTEIEKQGGRILTPSGRLTGPGYASGCYVRPVIAQVQPDFAIVQTETFAPILYVMVYDDLQQAIDIQNGVPQGLSSAIMTDNLKEAERFLSVTGSDCGIANVNIGTSGAEIGGAFGGEKHTGGGRESGSDAWKSYMRRQTSTINYGDDLPLAQGIDFHLG
ncbi:aldehyde dehydrogenase (NAD+) [Arachidicoccus rhizosphaerae]|uniref:aldehyde dehydrogenase (NAD(+)) n=1 Tax=Arachidicoccus rhizosphaerae TaxID=551991 RepID=A0A1H3WXA3_9BACT|nr:aldehyde dehydrogenase family protein [Arachidicoccus rhizosphaerae]SDZ91779.1 aldehyde dehydrogenase (NAD+) [Arachidicoccus rhizosphaerae]